MNINANIVDHPEFKWMPGMLGSNRPNKSGLMNRIITVCGPDLIFTDQCGEAPARGLVAVDLDDPATVGCLTHSSGMDWSESKIRRIALGTCYKGGE